MGNWVLHVEGHGIHDNGREDDADAMFWKFVKELKEVHEISSATMTVGAKKDMLAKEGS